MRIAAFGDLHLGHRPCLDKFRGSEESLLEFADHLERDHDRIMLMGDIYQTDYGAWPGSSPDVLAAIIKRFPRISHRWRSSPYTMILGNHDRIVGACLNAVEEEFVESDGWRLWFIHGHQFDPLSRCSKRPYFVTWAIGGLRRLRLRHAADFLEGPFFAGCQTLLEAQDVTARRIIVDGQCDVAVMGHTHVPRCQGAGAGAYVNCGACTASEFHYASIDTELRRIEVRSYQPQGGCHAILKWSASPRFAFAE